MKEQITYQVLVDHKGSCPKCNGPVHILCPASDLEGAMASAAGASGSTKVFFICWQCRRVHDLFLHKDVAWKDLENQSDPEPEPSL